MDTQETGKAFLELRSQTPQDQYSLARAAFDSIVKDLPLDFASLGRELGLDADAARKAADALVESGLLTTDESRSKVTGALGLSTTPAAHRLNLAGRELYAWCALDAVGIPAALGLDARVESRIADTGQLLTVEIVGGAINKASADGVRIPVPRPDLEANIMETLCPEIVFLSTGKAPAHPAIAVLTLDQAAEVGKAIWSANETGSRKTR